MQKNVIFIPHQLLNRPQPYLLMHLITDIHYNDKFLGTVKLLPESVIGLKKINKNKKHFGGRPRSSKLWNRSVSEYIKPVHSTQFHLPKNQNYQSL